MTTTTDLFGNALLDFLHGEYTEDISTETNISEADDLPLPYLFRGYSEMPNLEQKALDLCFGKILDVGCGAGSHSLHLQQEGFDVTAIDISKGATQVANLRGVQKTAHKHLLETSNTFDTILILMNGTGIFQTLADVPKYLQHLLSILTPKGQILIDSSDIRYMFDSSDEEGGIWVPADRYYGELEFIMHYKGGSSTPFPWLYLDAKRFEQLAIENGFNFEILEEGENFDYLARLSVAEYTLS